VVEDQLEYCMEHTAM